MDGILDFFSREAGQRRRRDLEDAISYYVPPELRGLLGLASELNPVVSMERAGQDAQGVFAPDAALMDRLAAGGRMASNMAGVLAPVAAGRAVAMPAAQIVEEALTGVSMSPQALGVVDFVTDEGGALRLRTPGAFTVRGDEFFDTPHGIARKKDPALYTPFSQIKHTTPPVEYEVKGQILPTLTDPEVIEPSALLGKTLYFPTGDRTSNQRLIEEVNGIILPTPTLTHGGPEYKDFQGSWASEHNALKARANALQPGLLAGEDQLLAYMPMGERSGDFSTHMAEVYGGMVDGSARNSNIRSTLDDVVPQEFKDMGYPGVNSGEFSTWLAGLDGGKQAQFIKYLDTAIPQESGMPDVAAARFAVTNPDLIKSDALSVGYRFSKPDVAKGLIRSDEHPSYNAKLDRVAGTTSQTLGFEVPWWIGARDTAASKVTDKGYALPKDIKSYMGNPKLKQVVDPQWVEEVSTYGELLRTDGEEAARRYALGLLDAILAKR